MEIAHDVLFSSCEDLFQAIRKPVFIYDKNHILVYANSIFFELLNTSRKELIRTNINTLLSKHINKEVNKYEYEILDASIPFIFNIDRKKYLSRAIPITIGKHIYSVVILEDIEIIDFIISHADTLTESLDRLSPEEGIATFETDLEGRIIESSETVSRLLGYTVKELSTMSISDIDLSFIATELVKLLDLQSNKAGLIISRMLRKKDGSFCPVRIFLRYLKNGSVKKILYIIQSNQDYLDLEYSVKHRILYDGIVSETKRILFAKNHEMGKMIDLVNFYVKQVDCDALSLFLYSEDYGQTRITRWNKQNKKTSQTTLSHERPDFRDWLLSQFRKRSVLQINQISELPNSYEPEQSKLLQSNITRLYYFGIFLHDNFYGYIQVNLTSQHENFPLFSIEVLKMLAEVLLQYLEHQREIQATEAFHLRLKNSFYEMINAVVKMVEERDPFTAGHQLRVAALATAIAKTMGLSESRVEAVRLAALIHDIGKIKIPAEILSVPRKLNASERSLMETHPQSGYDILGHIHFDAPIQEYVLDHHERLDGSGYPNHKKGDEIALETRIISVADVYEAMTSHRPYRPAKPINIALSELRKNENKLYDKAVVDAFLDVLLIQEFQFPPQFYKI